MKRYMLWILGGILAMILLVVIVSFIAPSPTTDLHTLTLLSPGGESIPLQVEWAVTPEEQEVGLMNRSQVTHGMLFLFPKEITLNFWMKNTVVPLDIVFFDANGTYVSATTMQPCAADPCAIYPSDGPAQYALEMPAGFLGKTPIAKNWKMKQ